MSKKRTRQPNEPIQTPEQTRVILSAFIGMFTCLFIGTGFTLWNSPCSPVGTRIRNTGCLLRESQSQSTVTFLERENAWVFSADNAIFIEDISDVRDRDPTRRLPLPHDENAVERFMISADLTTIASLAVNGETDARTLYVWDIVNEVQLWERRLGENTLLGGISADGSQVVLVEGMERQIIDVASRDQVASIDATSFAFSPDGTIATTEGQTLTLRSADLTPQQTFTARNENDLACTKFSPDGQYVTIGDTASLDLIEVATGETVFTLEEEGRFHRCAFNFSADTVTLMVGTFTPGDSDARIVFYDLEDGSEQILDVQYTFPLDMAISADRTLLAIGGAETAYLVDLLAVEFE